MQPVLMTARSAKALEIGVVGGFARGCQAGGITQFSLLSAAGSTAKSKFRYVRVHYDLGSARHSAPSDGT